MKKDDINKIETLISSYFQGIYEGNISELEKCFTTNTQILGDIKGVSYQKTITEYLEGVKNRKSPKELNEVFNMKIISIEILGEIAMVKAQVPMLGYNYFDFLSLLKKDNTWKITHKIFTHID
ncbi:nuclear transport factor 2 family protein [Aureivirga sp. CE67]|uniref:nuclear transport factor 2 family protein n=1 Tax=Aureivirga sp. CE67 TaxID=1788983 RepID=UPI0018CBB95A|nr:nuclear transport factor 2 family protein [Aureivirga sp. CE67]